MQLSHSGQLDVAHGSQCWSLAQSSGDWQRTVVDAGALVGAGSLGLGLERPPQATIVRTSINAEQRIVRILSDVASRGAGLDPVGGRRTQDERRSGHLPGGRSSRARACTPRSAAAVAHCGAEIRALMSNMPAAMAEALGPLANTSVVVKPAAS